MSVRWELWNDQGTKIAETVDAFVLAEEVAHYFYQGGEIAVLLEWNATLGSGEYPMSRILEPKVFQSKQKSKCSECFMREGHKMDCSQGWRSRAFKD